MASVRMACPARRAGSEALALGFRCLFGRELVRSALWGIYNQREQHRPTRSQRPPRPPQIQRRGMPVPDRLLPRRRSIDRLQRDGDFDQFLFVLFGHRGPYLGDSRVEVRRQPTDNNVLLFIIPKKI